MRKTFTYKGKRYSVQRKNEKDIPAAIIKKKKEIDSVTDSFSAFAWEWFRVFKEPYISENTKTMYRSSIRTLEKYIGSMKVNRLSSADFQKIITAEMSSKSKVDKLILTAKQITKRAGIEINIERPRLKENHRRALTMCEEHVIREVCKTSRYGAWIETMLFMGLRPSETSMLRKKDVQNGYLHVRGTKSDRSDRYIPIPEALIFDLRGLNEEDYIFTTDAKKPLTRQSIGRWWKYFKRDLDLYMDAPTYRNRIVKSYIPDDISLYTLRHTFGTRAQQNGVPIDVLADLMGHEKIETTRKYYISDNFESKELQREKINQMWK